MARDRGWKFQYLLIGDEYFGSGRMKWWMEVDSDGKLPERDIPHIDFGNANSNTVSKRDNLSVLNQRLAMKKSCNGKCPPRALTPAGALAHINDLVLMLGSGWSAMGYIVRWLAWGLGVGTGRMLLSASNHSVKLFGCDIDPMMVDCCAINMALYAPWAVYQTPRQKAVMRTLRTDNEAMAVNMADLREVEGHSKIKKPEEYDAHGQGMLFSFGKENK